LTRRDRLRDGECRAIGRRGGKTRKGKCSADPFWAQQNIVTTTPSSLSTHERLMIGTGIDLTGRAASLLKAVGSRHAV